MLSNDRVYSRHTSYVDDCYLETMRVHIDEPNLLPTVAIADIRKRLTQLTKCTEEIESKLHLQEIRSA